jgi:hypothetical protein
VEVRDQSPLRLNDPEFLQELVRPRVGPLRLLGMLVMITVARAIPASLRNRLRRLMRRSYV